MAKKKHNPYGEFVKAEYMLLKKSNPKFNEPMGNMFSNPTIKEKWESSDKQTKQKFRDIANSKNNGVYDSNFFHYNHQTKTANGNNHSSAKPDKSQRPPEASATLFESYENIIRSKTQEELLEATLYSFSCNVMCADIEAEGHYIPLEIAIYAYTIKDGVPKDKPAYLTFVNPGPPPVGRMNEAKQHYQDTKHAIPFPPFAPFLKCARSDYRQIYKEILEYVGPEKILLVPGPGHVEQARGVLKWLAKKSVQHCRPDLTYLPSTDPWLIYDISDYIFELGKRLNSPLPTSVCIEMLLENMGLAYADNSTRNNLNCEWHNLPQNETQWCAKSCSIRNLVNLKNLLDWFKETYTKRKESQQS